MGMNVSWEDERPDIVKVFWRRALLAKKRVERLMDRLFDDVYIPWHLSKSTKLKILERFWEVEILDYLPLDHVYNCLGVMLHTGVVKPEKGYIVALTIIIPKRTGFIPKEKAYNY